MDFFEHQHIARKKTRLLVFYFVMAVLLIIAVLNTVIFQILNNSKQYHFTLQQWFTSDWFIMVTLGTLGIIVVGSLLRGMQISGGGKSVAKMVNARPIEMSSRDPLERRFINVVEEMSIASGMPVPSLFVMDDEMGMNAFVAGLVPSDTVMVVTKGLLENLNRQELQGVVAHEFSHIFNADMRLNVRLIAILGGILALGQLGYFLLRSMRYSGRRRSSSGSNNQLGLVIIGAAITLLLVGYIGLFFGRLIKAAVSRQREFLADASAVQYSRDPMGIANALYRIKTGGKGSLLDSSHAEDMSHMCFGTALNFSAFGSMLATHPPIDIRIKKLVPGYKPPVEGSEAAFEDDEMSVAAGFASQQQSSQAVETTTAEQLMAQIGQLHPDQLHKAIAIHRRIPEELLDTVHSKNSIASFILALIVRGSLSEASASGVDRLLEVLGDRLSTGQLAQIKSSVAILKELPEQLTLPLIEMSIPVLKQLEQQQKKQLLATASVLITADNRIEPFEFFLYALLRKHLDKKDAAFDTRVFRKYKPVLGDIHYLVAVISEASGKADPSQIHNVMKSFDINWQQPSELPTYNAKQLNQSLQRLNQLTPLLKKPLLQTLAEIVMQDGSIDKTEIELLRATGIYLESPIPPLN